MAVQGANSDGDALLETGEKFKVTIDFEPEQHGGLPRAGCPGGRERTPTRSSGSS